jgi:glycosyltransferase involved in cell wall biosynthesis
MESRNTVTATPLVSIVIPAYNHAPYLAETIDSVLQQTYAHWELILIDDGSTDDTPTIIQRYTDPRIRSFRQENHGLSATLNRGVSLARGVYFAFLPSDDAYEPDKLALQVKVLEDNPTVGVVFSRQRVTAEQGQPTSEQQVQEWFEVPFTTKEEIFPALFERDFLSTPTHLLRMECFARIGLFDESLVTTQDYDLWLRMLKHYDIRLLSERLARMRWHGQNQTRVATLQTEQERATVLLKAFRSLSITEIFPSLTHIAPEVYPESFAHAYLTLARYTIRNGLAALVPVARLYLTRALEFNVRLHVPEELSSLLTASPGLRHRQESVEQERRLHQDESPSLVEASNEVVASVSHRPEETLNIVIEVPTLDTGGVEEVVFSMVTGLPREQFRFLVVCVERGGATAERCRRQGVPVEILQGEKEDAYRHILQRYRASLVVSHYSSFGLPIAAQLGIPVISFVHGLYAWFREGILGEMGAWDQYVSRYVAVSHDIAEYLTDRFHIAREKISVIPNGVEIVNNQDGEARTGRARWGIGLDDYVFLNVAAISPTKGHFTLLEAVRIVADEYPAVKVLCVGATLDEQYQQRLLQKRQQYQLEERFIFTGFHADVAPFYRMADAFVFPSVLEGFGLAKLEAMAHGLPLILTRVGDSARLIDHDDIGLLVPNAYDNLSKVGPDNIQALLECETPPNVDALAAAMKDFVRRAERWREAGRLGREKVLRKFTREQALRSYAALFAREAWLEQNRRDTDKVLIENRALRSQVMLLERLVLEQTQTVQEKTVALQEKTAALQEKELALLTQEQHFSESLRKAEEQQARLTALQQTITQQFREQHGLSLAIFDRLDVTKRLRTVRARCLVGLRRCLPPPVKRSIAWLLGRGRALRRKVVSLRSRLFWGAFSPAYVYQRENNCQVTLYTDRDELFPGYQPRRSLRNRMRSPVQASLIVTVRNEKENAEQWLDSLSQQTRTPDEVVVVDGGSTDGTLEILQDFARRSAFKVVVLAEPGANIARGRNLAIAHARFSVLACTDFGCRLRNDWLEQVLAPFEDDADMQVVGGWYESVEHGRPRPRRRWPTLREVAPHEFIPSSRSFAFVKSAWEAVGGYPEWLTLTGEDTYFALELQKTCRTGAFVPDAVVEWEAPSPPASYWRKVYGWSIGDGESGVHARYYWRSGARVVSAMMVALFFALLVGVAGVLLGPRLKLFLAVSALVLGSVGVVMAARGKLHSLTDLLWESGGEAARVLGFLQGARRRPVVQARRLRAMRGTFFVLSGVPIDDTGGGARCTQLALALLQRGFAVVFINKFPKHESANLHLRMHHPFLFTRELAAFNWEAFVREHPFLLTEKPLGALVEFPLAEFLPLLARIREREGVVVYDLLDDWKTSLGDGWYSPTVEREILAASHVLAATALSLQAHLREISGRSVALLPNAVNPRLFSSTRRYPRPRDFPSASWSILYMGALWGEWFDWDLLADIARRYADAAMVVIGDYRGQWETSPANVYFLGLKAQRELPAYVQCADVAIIPWKVSALTQATSPLKVYEYLAMGKPVVAPLLEPLADMPCVLRSESNAAFLDNIERARQLHIDGEHLNAFLRQNSWETRVAQLLTLVGEQEAAPHKRKQWTRQDEP